MLLGVLFGAPALCAPVVADPHGLQPIEDMAKMPGVTTTVTWEDCGEPNAYYHNGKAVLCNELVTAGVPDFVIQFYLAHELAHGIIDQLDIPITGNEEFAADELAMLMLHMTGRDHVLVAAARFYGKRGRPEAPHDEHPGDLRRSFNAFSFMQKPCSYPPKFNEVCSDAYKRASRNWARLIIPHVEKHGGF